MDEETSRRDARQEGLSDRQVLNIVSDLGGGPSIRAKDNLYQALAILVCTLIGAVIGIIVGIAGAPWWAGAVVGGFGGLVVGFFASGIFLMIYRAIKHAHGQHD